MTAHTPAPPRSFSISFSSKQKSKLRKLLNEYAAAVAAHTGGEGGAGFDGERSRGGAAPFVGTSSNFGSAAAAPAPAASIVIRPDQRLSYEHLSWWFAVRLLGQRGFTFAPAIFDS